MKDSFLLQKSFYRGCAMCIKDSFILASKGKEEIPTLIWGWALMSYLITYCVFYQSVHYFGLGIISSLISLIVIVFYLWHMVAIVRCRPKQKKLTKTEKKQKKLIDGSGIARSFVRKLLLQEPWFKTKTYTFVLVIDLLIITTFFEYLI